MSNQQTRAMQEPSAPDVDVSVHPGGNGDLFLVFDEDEGGEPRHVVLLNPTDANELYRKLQRYLGEDDDE